MKNPLPEKDFRSWNFRGGALFSALFSVLCAALFLSVLAAAPARADDLLQGIQRQLTLDGVIHGDFVQTRQLAGVKKPLVSRGRFLVAREHGVIWQSVTPFVQTMRVTRDEIVQTDGTRTLMKMTADKEPVVRILNGILFSVFSGDLETLSRYFDSSGTVDRGQWRVRFTPRDDKLAALIRELRLEGGHTVRRVELDGAAGDLTRIEFQSVATAAALTPEERRQFE